MLAHVIEALFELLGLSSVSPSGWYIVKLFVSHSHRSAQYAQPFQPDLLHNAPPGHDDTSCKVRLNSRQVTLDAESAAPCYAFRIDSHCTYASAIESRK